MPTTISEIVYYPLAELRPRGTNPRTHSAKQIKQLTRSLEQFGFTNPILVDDERQIIAGHGRFLAAEKLGIDEVPTICLAGMTDVEIRAYVIADNRLAELAGWDDEVLALELQGLSEIDLDFDLTVIGFEPPEIDILIQGIDDQTDDEAAEEEAPPPPPSDPVTQEGDLWIIGDHRLICGSALDSAAVGRLLDGEHAQMVFTDPPYNVPIAGHVSGLGQKTHREFAMATGEMDEEQFITFLQSTLQVAADHSIDGSLHFVCMDWRHTFELLNAARFVYTETKNLCVWNKTNGGMGSLYRSQHELVFVFKSGTAKHINNVELGRFGRNRTNVWTYPGVNSFGTDRDEELAMHPTVKPVSMVADAIRDCSTRGSIVLDVFAGSGTTLVAAAKTGRKGYGVELDPRYCDVILGRLREATGLQPILADTSERYSEIAKTRRQR